MTERALYEMVRHAWAPIAAPPEEDMKLMDWGWGEAAARAFTGAAPVDVDIRSPGFHAATPLFDLPPRAAAAYLGTYLLSLLEGLEFQRAVGLFDDVVTRAHTVTCLSLPSFWDGVIRKHLPPPCQEAVKKVALFLAANRDALPLNQQQVDILTELATRSDT
jgi:hypothetical protein